MVCVFVSAALFIQAQVPTPPPAPSDQPLSDAQLDQLLGPIALYPDPLIAEILPASTFPTQIVLADRYVTGGGDPNQISQQPWDASVQAVARYPNVLKWMDDNLGMTTELGQAFLNQPQAVMASIQRLRATASQLGNLQSTPQQEVTDDDGDIEIDPTNDQEMYVPDYIPDQVYDDSANGIPFITFSPGYPIGDWMCNDFDWGNNTIIVWNHGNRRPPNWWHQSRGQRDTGHTTTWRPSNHPGAGMANRGDRGWAHAPSPEVMRQEQARQASPQNNQVNTVPRTTLAPGMPRANSTFTGGEPARQAPQQEERGNIAPRPVERAEPIYRPESNGAFIGMPSAHDTRTYSDRGQQSMHVMAPSAPSFHPAPASYAAPSGGGGGHAGGGNGGHR